MAVGYNQPNVVIMDQCAAQIKAVEIEWNGRDITEKPVDNQTSTIIVYCIMHLHRNIQENIGRLHLTFILES